MRKLTASLLATGLLAGGLTTGAALASTGSSHAKGSPAAEVRSLDRGSTSKDSRGVRDRISRADRSKDPASKDRSSSSSRDR